MQVSAFRPNDEQLRLLQISMDAKAIVDLMGFFDRSNRTKFKKSHIAPLIEAGLLEMTDPGSPNSPKQKYRTSGKGKELTKNN